MCNTCIYEIIVYIPLKLYIKEGLLFRQRYFEILSVVELNRGSACLLPMACTNQRAGNVFG